jgi:hypothetical protein
MKTVDTAKDNGENRMDRITEEFPRSAQTNFNLNYNLV